MREVQIENYLVREIKKLGGLCWKFTSPGQRGVPDRIILLPKGKVIFVELKTETGRLSVLQQRTITVLKNLGQRTYVLKSKEEVKQFIEELRREL